MNKYKEFLNYLEPLLQGNNPDFVGDVLVELRAKAEEVDSKPLFTESGLQILEYLQANNTKQKAKDIAEGMGLSSRKISGAIRKLCTDGFVDKHGQNPVIYELTEQGKNFDITSYKESMNNA